MSDLFLLTLPIQTDKIVMEGVTMDTLADEENALFVRGAQDTDNIAPLEHSLACGTGVYRTTNGRACVTYDKHYHGRVCHYMLMRVRFLDEHDDVRAFILSKLTRETPLLPGAIIVDKLSIWVYKSETSPEDDVPEYEYAGYSFVLGGRITVCPSYMTKNQLFTPDAHVLCTAPCMADYELK